jgi:hypothetical protein
MATEDEDDDSRRPQDDPETRVEDLKARAAALDGGQMRTWTSPDCPSGIEKQFWEQVVAFESAAEEQPFEVLIRSGLTLPSPEELDDAQITKKLWDVIHGMAFLRMFLSFTDHLSDRELYTRLWSDTLREPTALEPEGSAGGWFIDSAGSGSQADIEVYLKYYAGEDERRRWAEEWPDLRVPNTVPLPFDRDRHLPTAGF